MTRRPIVRRLTGVVRDYLPDLVYGANDGIITTFAVVSGVVGANLSERIILILGFANLVADGFSMGASNFLARRSSGQSGRHQGAVVYVHRRCRIGSPKDANRRHHSKRLCHPPKTPPRRRALDASHAF